MRIYELVTNDINFSSFYFPIEEERKKLELFAKKYFYSSKNILEYWEPLIILEKEIKQKPDFAFLEDEFIIVSKKASIILREYCGKDIELLPLQNDVEEYFLLRVIRIANVLDEVKTIAKRLPYSNKLLRIIHFEFLSKKIEQEYIFKLPELIYEIFVSDLFKSIYNSNNLLGLEFTKDELVWENETII